MKERRTQAERRAESQDRLLRAAIQLLGTHGYARTSLAEIGKAAGLSRGLVSHHFGSKEACMRAVVTKIRETAGELITESGARGLDRIDRLFELYFDGVRHADPTFTAMVTIMVESLTSTPGLRPTVSTTNDITRKFVAELLTKAVAESSAALTVDVDALSVLITGILRGVALQYQIDPENVDLGKATETAKAMVRATIVTPAAHH
ncbi:TetR/AcrR family transcriptional regulator [Actinocorallia sp. API 0066]|uniref:TetR/AcrR family transcriptional regulator n=1 Tax=Actinocorallia sp. API 0066 TaxID=2896846 RepID=UPI001E295963|nr:TetR/AcrR family transcriptional regulator [Actinocorallia sp. API 0066]MCD0453044.1 TetR/AcrR family transcriptional regulator [Actinocorallia sp. API 0066]